MKTISGLDKYNLNYIIQPDQTNEQVFEMLKPLLVSGMEGYNICIIAYGASGKKLIVNCKINCFF